MIKNKPISQNGFLQRIKILINEADIRVLVILPPIIGLGLLLIFGSGYYFITGDKLGPPFNQILIEIASFFVSLSGLAQIYKKEMIGPFDRIIKGNMAIISGVTEVVISVSFGLAMFLFAILGEK